MKWLKEEFTKTPGYMRVNLSLLMILATSSVLSTGLQIYNLANNTSCLLYTSDAADDP